MTFDTFQKETKIIAQGESLLKKNQAIDFKDAYGILLTEYKALAKISRRLVRMSDRSEETLRETNEGLKIARDAAEAAKEETRQFIAMISHELRTPLAILQSEVELLSEGIRQPTPEHLASLQDEISHFTRLINDMFELSLSDIHALHFEKAAIDLQSLLQRSVTQFKPMFADKNMTVQMKDAGDAMPFWGDAQRINQVMANVLKNSYHYTDAGGQLQISTYVKNDTYGIEFADSSPGLTDQALDKIFQRFFRGESSRNRATGGAGLGMSICQSIMTEHGGKISATHSPLGGICIGLSFPISEE